MNDKMMDALQKFVMEVSNFAVATSSVAGTHRMMELATACHNLNEEIKKEKARDP